MSGFNCYFKNMLSPLIDTVFGTTADQKLVVYKAYPHMRAADAPGLLQLSRVLPVDTSFFPIPPDPSLSATANVPRQIATALLDAGVVVESPETQAWLGEQKPHRFAESVFLPGFLAEVLGRLGAEGKLEKTLQLLDKPENSALRDLLIQSLSHNARDIQGPDLRNSPPELPADVPVLVVGRAGFLYGFRDSVTVKGRELRTIGKVLRDAQLPNRFSFLEDVVSTRYTDRDTLQDARTGRSYCRPEGVGRREVDYGFISIRLGGNRSPVAIACGSSCTGTYAACLLLMSNRPSIARALEVVREKHQDEVVYIDVGFRAECDPRILSQPFQLTRSSESIRIDLINTDLVGFRTNRDAEQKFGQLLRRRPRVSPAPEEPCTIGDDLIRFEWNEAEREIGEDEQGRRLTTQPVKVYATDYGDSPDRRFFPSAPLADVLDDWSNRLRRAQSRWKEAVNGWDPQHGTGTEDRPHTMPRPILLLGPSGCGKGFVCNYFSRLWAGPLLPERLFKEIKRDESLVDKANLALAETAKTYGSPHDLVGMIQLNVNSLTTEQATSELYGIHKGAATSVDPRPGVFIRAGFGTLFLDEIADMSPELQPRLFTVLEEGKVWPQGGSSKVNVAPLVVAATARAETKQLLNQMHQQGVIRPELTNRFQLIEIPALRDRVWEIIPTLMTLLCGPEPSRLEFMTLRISQKAFHALITLDFPGNLRDLKNLAQRVDSPQASRSRSEMATITFAHLQQLVPSLTTQATGSAPEGKADPELDFLEFKLIVCKPSFELGKRGTVDTTDQPPARLAVPTVGSEPRNRSRGRQPEAIHHAFAGRVRDAFLSTTLAEVSKALNTSAQAAREGEGDWVEAWSKSKAFEPSWRVLKVWMLDLCLSSTPKLTQSFVRIASRSEQWPSELLPIRPDWLDERQRAWLIKQLNERRAKEQGPEGAPHTTPWDVSIYLIGGADGRTKYLSKKG